MSALKIKDTLGSIEQNMKVLSPYRRPALFSQFLVKGYTAVTLSSVPEAKFSELLRAKVCLGTLITLYDDLADRPTQQNSQLLEVLYGLDFQRCDFAGHLNADDRHIVSFAKSLFIEMNEILMRQPHYQHLNEVLNFDLKQFYSANQFSSLLTANPFINNSLENRLYAHHNMGMVMAAMMDLISIRDLNFAEFGAIREVLLMGQRMGRIFNVLSTRKREFIDGDITGELSICRCEIEIAVAERKLRNEIQELHDRIYEFNTHITTFSIMAYLKGLTEVQVLHEKMEGII